MIQMLGIALFVLMMMSLKRCLACARHASKAHDNRRADAGGRYWVGPLSMFRDRYYTKEGQKHRQAFAADFKRLMILLWPAPLLVVAILWLDKG